MTNKEVHILVTSDNHAGNKLGLIPPRYQSEELSGWASPFWDWYVHAVKKVGEVDCHLHLGDATDGPGHKDNAIGLITTDTSDQGRIAADTLRAVRARRRYLVYGTPYHTAGSYSYEDDVARRLDCEVVDTLNVQAGGVRINARHVVSSSQTPYGQGGLAAKEAIRDLIVSIQEQSEPADLVLRGHAHTYVWHDNGSQIACIAPSLQLPGSIFGRTQRPWWYRVGILELWIRDGRVFPYPHLMTPIVGRKREYVAIG